MPEAIDWREYCFRPETAVGGNSVRLFKEGESAFAEMLGVIRSAREYLLLEFYAIADDAIGRMFREQLLQKVREGVKVYLIYDGVGSLLTDREFFASLASGGVHLVEFRPIVLWKPYRSWARRDHRKIIAADGNVALVGGFNLTAHDAPVSLGGRGWKDALVRVEGPIVSEIEKLFRSSWTAAGGAGHAPGGRRTREAGGIIASVLSASGMRNFRSIRRSYSYAIDKARRYIYITNAYFLPDRFVYRRLIRAVRRGVDVRIIGPLRTDHPYVRWATWSIYPHMIRNGIRVCEWQGGILHSKTAVIDGVWSSVGSHNLDHRSLHYNMEMNINIHDPAFGAEMTAAFEEDLRNSRPVTLEDTKRRPLLSKIASKALYFFRSLL